MCCVWLYAVFDYVLLWFVWIRILCQTVEIISFSQVKETPKSTTKVWWNKICCVSTFFFIKWLLNTLYSSTYLANMYIWLILQRKHSWQPVRSSLSFFSSPINASGRKDHFDRSLNTFESFGYSYTNITWLTIFLYHSYICNSEIIKSFKFRSDKNLILAVTLVIERNGWSYPSFMLSTI